MGGVNVKNTMIERVLQAIAPHLCSGCGKLGTSLCLDCKYDIVNDPFLGCIKCGLPQPYSICLHHKSAIERAFVVGTRSSTLEKSTNELKFSRSKASAKDLAELLAMRLPHLPPNTYLVPLPTSAAHIRQRGYDQVDLVTRHLAVIRNLPVARLLIRKGSTVQHESSRQDRVRQAFENYRLDENVAIDKSAHYLLVDDIITTGSSVEAAAQQLSKAGIRSWVAALAYQPLD